MQTVILLTLLVLVSLECLCLIFSILFAVIKICGSDNTVKIPKAAEISEDEQRKIDEMARTMEQINAIMSYDGGGHGKN